MTDTDPFPYRQEPPGHGYRSSGPGYQSSGPGYQPAPPPYQAPSPDYEPAGRARRPRDGSGVRRTALIIHSIADVAAAFLVLWIVLYMFDANQANVFVQFVKGVADWLAGWSQDIFTMDTEQLRVLLNYGLPALIYLGAGHGIAARMRHL
ncbi:hypothetical protein [Streptomyces sp. TS71-3]|uniref:hypothetical protein n=1 Tax=Streptomyces sp. TS71-3 TaxID=2733862 RepID=UPI001B27FEC6|nr:hypothetical protein [Streptomyces sp. TS71-3]GHJ37017.1 hypothetical protein Sm713_26260 [Streptomyces sp. TS71-3]